MKVVSYLISKPLRSKSKLHPQNTEYSNLLSDREPVDFRSNEFDILKNGSISLNQPQLLHHYQNLPQ